LVRSSFLHGAVGRSQGKVASQEECESEVNKVEREVATRLPRWRSNLLRSFPEIGKGTQWAVQYDIAVAASSKTSRIDFSKIFRGTNSLSGVSFLSAAFCTESRDSRFS
jgi:hypothetical protein